MIAEATRSENLSRLVEVPQIGSRVSLADFALALGVERGEVVLVLRVLEVHFPRTGVGGAIAPQTSRQDAIEHVDSAEDGADDVGGGADAHEVARAVVGEERRGVGEDFERGFLRLTNGETSDGVAVERKCRDALCASGAQLLLESALDDAEERLGGGAFVGLETSDRPAVGTVGGFLGLVGVGRMPDGLVEGHDDVGVNGMLDLGCGFRCEQVLGPVDVGSEGDSVVGDLYQRGQAEYLISPAVGEGGPRPVHEGP